MCKVTERILFLKFVGIFKIRKNSWILRIFKIRKIRILNLCCKPPLYENLSDGVSRRSQGMSAKF